MQPERVGRVRQVKCPLASGPTAGMGTRTGSLQAWAEKLAARQVHAVSVVREDQSIGLCTQRYWLVLLTGPAFEAPEDMVHLTEEIPAGWLVVPAVWLDLCQVSERAYRQLKDEVMIVVNTIVRLEGEHGVGVKVTMKGRGNNKKIYVSESEHHKCDASVHVD